MKRLLRLAAIVFLAACSASAKTFDVDISTGRPAASNEAFYHGETIEFRAVRGRSVVTNIEYSCIWYTTNNSSSVASGEGGWWKTDGLVFHPTNDVGAAAYRFFLEGRDEIGRDWHANGLLRFLPSPGFEPSAVQLPVQTLDFSKVTVLNPPWHDTDLTPATNYTDEAVAAQSAAQSAALTDATNALSAALSAAKQDKLPYPTNAIPQSVISGLSTALAGKLDKTGGTVMGLTVEDASMPIFSIKSANAEAAFWMNGTNVMVTVFNFNTGSISTYHFDRVVDDEVAVLGDLQGLGVDLSPATNYTDSASAAQRAALANASNDLAAAISSLETDISEIDAYPQSSGEALERQVAAVSNEAQLVYRLYSGSNVVCEVTNYNSRVSPPQMRLLQFDGTNGYFEVWNETNGLSRAERAAKAYADGQFAVLPSTYAPRAWSRTTSWYGADAPSNTTWISTPTTVLAGGLEFESAITASGTLCFLACRGTTVQVYTNQSGCVSYTAADGTELFAIEKTDSYLIGVDADSIHVDGNTVTIGVPVVAESHPYVRYRQPLVGQSGWEKEEDGFASPISVSWSGSTGAYVCTVTTTASSGFFYFEYLQQGGTKLVVDGVLKVRDGILCTDGVHVAKPVYSNGSVTWQAQ